MILVDANLLIYAVDQDSAHHAAARRWLEAVLSDTEPVALSWTVLLAFLRVTTRAGVLRRPLDLDRALGYVDSWLEQPCVKAVGPTPAHWSIYRRLLRFSGSSGNLTSDAHLAALALEHAAEIHSADHDFGRFPGVSHINPVAPA